MESIKEIINWCNSNCGFLTLLLFLMTILWGWVSGFFSQIKKKPKFKIEILGAPTFCCKMSTNRICHETPCFRTIVVLYLSVSNIGNAASSINEIKVGYKTKAIDYIFKRYWLKEHVSLLDFTAKIGEDTKVYPFFNQKNNLTENKTDCYLNIGQNKLGIVYFESEEYYGNYEPIQINNKINIRIKLIDVYGRKHYKDVEVPLLPIEEAKKFNEKIGQTAENLLKTDTNEELISHNK